jgi:hypothetical protein
MARPRRLARRLEWNQGVTRFIYIIDTDKQGNETKRFLNSACIQQIFQQGDDVYIEMTDYTEMCVKNTNINVFMDRFI